MQKIFLEFIFIVWKKTLQIYKLEIRWKISYFFDVKMYLSWFLPNALCDYVAFLEEGSLKGPELGPEKGKSLPNTLIWCVELILFTYIYDNLYYASMNFCITIYLYLCMLDLLLFQ